LAIRYPDVRRWMHDFEAIPNKPYSKGDHRLRDLLRSERSLRAKMIEP
jgi:hypothetical protein